MTPSQSPASSGSQIATAHTSPGYNCRKLMCGVKKGAGVRDVISNRVPLLRLQLLDGQIMGSSPCHRKQKHQVSSLTAGIKDFPTLVSAISPFKRHDGFNVEIASLWRLITEKHSELAGFWQQKEKTEGIAIFTIPTVTFHISLHRARREQDQTKGSSKFVLDKDKNEDAGSGVRRTSPIRMEAPSSAG